MSSDLTPYEKHQHTRTLSAIIWIVMIAALALGIFNVQFRTWASMIALLSLAAVCALLLWLNSRGQFAVAALILSVVVLMVINVNLFDGDGIRDSGILAYPIFIMVGTLFFGKRAAPGAKLIYLGNNAKKTLVLDKEAFAKLGISVSEHGKFPDMVLYDLKRKWLFLIEAVIVKGFISPKRRSELEQLFEQPKVGKVYITAFWNFATYTKYVDKIAWDTEVWIAEMPSHMIHFNGERFLGPR